MEGKNYNQLFKYQRKVLSYRKIEKTNTKKNKIYRY